MEDESLRYDQWIEEALREVVRRALMIAATSGFPGDHHFYITFETGAEGVVMPEYLRAQHPETMTIVLQHQFENLEVSGDEMGVSLQFGGKSEHLRIPFSAMTGFNDPSVNFGVQLNTLNLDDLEGEQGGLIPPTLVTDLEADSGEPGSQDNTDGGDRTAQVIALDTFRKK